MSGKPKTDESGLTRREKALWTTSLGMSTLSLSIALASLDRKKGKKRKSRQLPYGPLVRTKVEPLQCPLCKRGGEGITGGFPADQEYLENGLMINNMEYDCDLCGSWIDTYTTFRPVSVKEFLGEPDYSFEDERNIIYPESRPHPVIPVCPRCGSEGDEINDYSRHAYYPRDTASEMVDEMHCECKVCGLNFTVFTKYIPITREFHVFKNDKRIM